MNRLNNFSLIATAAVALAGALFLGAAEAQEPLAVPLCFEAFVAP